MTRSITRGIVRGRVRGIDRGGAGWTIDATSNKAAPVSSTEAQALLTAAAVSSGTVTNFYPFFSTASGNVLDDVGSKNLTAAGTWSYSQAVTGWSTQGIASSSGTSATFTNNTFANVNANNYTLFLLAKIDTPLGQRTVMRMGDVFDDDATFEITSSGFMAVGDGTPGRTTGAVDATSAARYWVLSIGTNVLLANDQELLTGGAKACNGTQLLFGGDNSQTWFPASTKYMIGFVVNAGLSSADIRAVLTEAGYTVAW